MRLKSSCFLLLLLLPTSLWAGLALPLPVVADKTVTLTLSSTAEALCIERAFEATLTLTTPEKESPIAFQLTTANVRGFRDLQSFQVASDVIADQRITTWRYLMTPDATGPWVIDPFVIVLENTLTKTTREVLVQGLTLPSPTALPAATGAPEITATPQHIPFGWRDAVLWVRDHVILLATFALLLFLALTWKRWLRPLLRYFKERTLPPERRAALEFQRLKDQRLLETGEIKRYFYELTGVVRRYFERAYTLRATRQTTDEFIRQLTQEIPMDATTCEAIQTFLQAADKVKFAGQQTSVEVAQQATTEAHAMITHDTAARHRATKSKGPTRTPHHS